MRVTIADFDVQATSLDWLNARPSSCPAIKGIDNHASVLPLHHTSDYLILDVPSGHYGEDILPWLKKADKIIIPVVPSPHDIRAAKRFLASVHVPCIGLLRDTQNYVLAAQHGLSIFELPTYKVKQDLQQWQRLIRWLCVDPYIYSDVPVKPDQSVYDTIYGTVL